METNFGSDDALGATSGIDPLASGSDEISDPGNYTDHATFGDGEFDSAPSDDDETITLDYAGDEQEYTANADLDGDGTNETAVVDQSDGSQMLLTDSDGDGAADQAKLLDVEGNLVDAKHLDADGEWVRDDVTGTVDDTGTPTDAISVNPDYESTEHTVPEVPEGQVYADLGGGNAGAAEATVDLDHDGTAETAVLRSSSGDGGQLFVVDADSDGVADIAGEYNASGELVATYHPDDDGVMVQDADIDRSSGDADAATYSVDPDTGEWTDAGTE